MLRDSVLLVLAETHNYRVIISTRRMLCIRASDKSHYSHINENSIAIPIQIKKSRLIVESYDTIIALKTILLFSLQPQTFQITSVKI